MEAIKVPSASKEAVTDPLKEAESADAQLEARLEASIARFTAIHKEVMDNRGSFVPGGTTSEQGNAVKDELQIALTANPERCRKLMSDLSARHYEPHSPEDELYKLAAEALGVALENEKAAA